jgi:hypothetical protein
MPTTDKKNVQLRLLGKVTNHNLILVVVAVEFCNKYRETVLVGIFNITTVDKL